MPGMSRKSYALVTAAFNEEAVINQTIASVLAQTHPPIRWIIVSDGSTDGTDAIIARHAGQHAFLRLLRITKKHPRNFTAQVNAINAGFAELKHVGCDFIGNFDADVTIEPDYFERVLGLFESDSELGLAGGCIYERCNQGDFRARKTNSSRSVPHAVQLFRRECFRQVRPYVPLPHGGSDSYAEVVARMKGWRVQSFADLHVFHHRPTNSAGSLLRNCFRQGRMDYSLGYLPAYEAAKLLRRLSASPILSGALARAAGFLYCYVTRARHEVPPQFMGFLRREQKSALHSSLAQLMRRPAA